MSFINKLRTGTLYRPVPKFIKTREKKPKKRKRARNSKANKEQKRRKSVHTLSKVDTETAAAIFKIHELESPDFDSVFVLMVLDLRILYPKLSVFEKEGWLTCMTPIFSEGLKRGASMLQCKVIVDRLIRIFESCEGMGDRDRDRKFCLSAAASLGTVWREVTGEGYPMKHEMREGQAGHYAEIVGRQLYESEDKLTLTQNWFSSWVPDILFGQLVILPTERLTTVERTLRPLLRADGSPTCNTNIFQNTKILKVSPPTGRLGISFQEALWLIESCKQLKPRKFLKFIQLWERVLLNSKQWLAALCLLSAVKASTFSKYLGRLRCFHKFINTWYFNDGNTFFPLENVVELIHKNQLDEDTLVKFALYRMTRVKFQTMRADFTALAFFFRHLPDKPVDFWGAFPKLREVLKSLGKYFDEEAEGSIFLEWEDMKTFLNFTLGQEFSDVEPQHLFDCFILAYWFALRISEACDLWFLNVRILPASQERGERLQLCVVDSKTNDRSTPWHLVTLNALPEPGWRRFCPVEAFRRIRARRIPEQTHLFTRLDGTPFNKTWMTRKFSILREAFRKAYPSIVSKGDKFSFHCFRISAIGFYIRDMGFTLYEAQTISRHKIGSQTTEKVYLAKGKHAFMKSLAHKIQDYIGETGQMPTARDEQDSFLLYGDSGKLAKRYKTFERKLVKPQAFRQRAPPAGTPTAEAVPLARETTPKVQSQAPDPIHSPFPGEVVNIPYDELSDSGGPPKLKHFRGTLLRRVQNAAGTDGFLVKFDGYPDPEFVDTLSILECRM